MDMDSWASYPDRATLRDLCFDLSMSKADFDRLISRASSIRRDLENGSGFEKDQVRRLIDPTLTSRIEALTTRLRSVSTEQEMLQKIVGDLRYHGFKLKIDLHGSPSQRKTPRQLWEAELEAADFVLQQDYPGDRKRAEVENKATRARRGLKQIATAEAELTELVEQAEELQREINQLRREQLDWRNFRLDEPPAKRQPQVIGI